MRWGGANSHQLYQWTNPSWALRPAADFEKLIDEAMHDIK